MLSELERGRVIYATDLLRNLWSDRYHPRHLQRNLLLHFLKNPHAQSTQREKGVIPGGLWNLPKVVEKCAPSLEIV